MKEIWKDIPGFEGTHQVSSMGRIKRLERSCTKKSRGGGTHVIHMEELILSPGDNGKGYKFVTLISDDKRRNCAYIHRLVLEAFAPNPKSKTQVNHINGDKSDNRLVNLEWCTPSENGRHAYENGLNRVSEYQKKQTSRANRGGGHGMSKLVEDDIPKIREMSNDGITNTEIARQFGVHRETIGHVLRGNTWTHV